MSNAFIATIGSSALSDAAQAGREAAELALSQAMSYPPRLAIVFGSAWFDQVSLVGGIHSVLGDTPLIGASTAGELLAEGPVSHRCVVVLLNAHAPICSVGFSEGVDRAPREAGQRAAYLASKQLQGMSHTGFLFFGDGLVTTYTEVVRGLQEVLGTNSLIIGGMAGDELRFAQTYQYCGDRVVSQSVVGASFCGPVKLSAGIEHGFTPISKPRRITRSSANILFELDRQPAASVYEEYFGEELVGRIRTDGRRRQSIANPIGIQ